MSERKLIVIPPMDDGLFVTREIGDSIYNNPPFHINPYSAVVYATKLKDQGHHVQLLDAQAMKITPEETKKRINLIKPDQVTYFISAFGVPQDTQCIEWNIDTQIVMSPIKTDIHEMLEIYSKTPPYFMYPVFITDPKQFIGKADFGFLAPYADEYKADIRININDFCPFQCTFCCRCNTKPHFKPVQEVREEIQYAMKIFRRNDFHLFMSEAGLDKNYTFDLCDAIEDLNITFRILDRVQLADAEMYARLKEVGMTEIHFGVESGCPKCLKTINKGITPDQAIEAFNMVRELKVYSRAYFIVGIPDESEYCLGESIELAHKLKADENAPSPLYPSPNSPMYEQMKKDGLLTTRRWEFYKHRNRRVLAFKHKKYANWKQLMDKRYDVALKMNSTNLGYVVRTGTRLIRRKLGRILG